MTDTVRSWNHKGYEGKPVRVEVYTDAEEIALFINGNYIKRKTVGQGKKNIACFETVYQPGIIEAAAYRDGVEVGRDCIKTASDNLILEAIPDREVIPADASDICYIDLFLKDEAGNLNPEAVIEVTVTVAGAGCLQGFGSAVPGSEENYFDTSAKTYEGRLRAAIWVDWSGEILVTFSSEGMRAQTVTILAEKDFYFIFSGGW